jgi:2-keto-4-pentenoate hydratase/2-oxohepta-3-ene-1,7-dioic acid hydratase in catechol pathway
MKLVRFGALGQEKPGLVDTRGQIRDLSSVVDRLDLRRPALVQLRELTARMLQRLPIVAEPVRLGAPVEHVGKFIAVGLNYRDHATEAGLAIPKEPILFTKATSCIVGPNDDVVLPRQSVKTDWEVELGVVIGETTSYIDESEALDHVAGYCVVNDLSERDFQFERGGTWDKGKGCDTFGPIGPYLVTVDEVADPQTLDMWLDVNGTRRQVGSTRTMIFTVSKLISYISQFMTLHPGDLVTTGTPPGVGMGQKPQPLYLKPGDVVELGISGLGVQRQQVVSWSPRCERSSVPGRGYSAGSA